LSVSSKTLELDSARLHNTEDSRSRILRVAKVPRPVLIAGERGTVKELVVYGSTVFLPLHAACNCPPERQGVNQR